MTNRDDEKAADKYAYPDDLYDSNQGGNIIIESMRNAFLAGCAHVRNSAEWKAMEKVVKQAKGITWFGGCHCDSAFIVRGRHEPDADCGELEDLASALAELDRIRGDK